MLSLSAADAAKFYWMRYASDRATVVTVKNEKVRIVKGDLFGVRELKGKDYDLVLLVDGSTFKLSIQKSDLLLDRGKEYRGKLPVIGAKAPAKAPAKKVVALNKFEKLLAKVGFVGKRIAATTPAVALKIMNSLANDAERIEFKKWLLSKCEKGSQKYKGIQAIIVGNKVVTKQKSATKSLRKGSDSPVNVKLSDIDLPDEDDFTDPDVPHEFLKYAKVESNYLSSVSSLLSVSDVGLMPGVLGDFNNIIKQNLEPHVKSAKHILDGAVKETAIKIKAWAIEHMTMAQKLGRKTELFEKLINNPNAAIQQLVNTLIGIKPVEHSKVDKKLDDLLSSLAV